MDDQESNCSDDVFLDETDQDLDKCKQKLTMSNDAKLSPPKFAVITMNRDARRQSIFDSGGIPFHLNLMSKGSSLLSFSHEPSGNVDTIDEEGEKLQYENTFKIEPDFKFPHDEVKEIMQDILTKRLKGISYDRPTSVRLCKTLAQEIKVKVKEQVERYKIITLVTIGEKKEQDVRMGSRCVWDVDRDSFASSYYENTEIFAVAVAYALYFE